MDKCLRNCKRLVEDMRPVTEVDNIHADGTKSRDMDEVSSKRRRSSGTTSSVLNVPLPANLNYMNISSSPANSTTSSVNTTVHEQSSDVVTNGFSRSTDPKLGDSETESSTFTIAEFRETSTASSEFACEDSGEVMESSSITNAKRSPKDTHLKFSAPKLPSAAQIEEFFTVAERHQQKRFAEKYNYDVVKDVPLEGRYQWVRLKP